jgi:hypothetical protein
MKGAKHMAKYIMCILIGFLVALPSHAFECKFEAANGGTYSATATGNSAVLDESFPSSTGQTYQFHLKSEGPDSKVFSGLYGDLTFSKGRLTFDGVFSNESCPQPARIDQPSLEYSRQKCHEIIWYDSRGKTDPNRGSMIISIGENMQKAYGQWFVPPNSTGIVEFVATANVSNPTSPDSEFDYHFSPVSSAKSNWHIVLNTKYDTVKVVSQTNLNEVYAEGNCLLRVLPVKP